MALKTPKRITQPTHTHLHLVGDAETRRGPHALKDARQVPGGQDNLPRSTHERFREDRPRRATRRDEFFNDGGRVGGVRGAGIRVIVPVGTAIEIGLG